MLTASTAATQPAGSRRANAVWTWWLRPLSAREHRAGVGVVARLAERPAVEVDDGVGADRQVAGGPGALDFAPRVNQGRLDGRAAGQRGFVVRRRDDVDVETER